MQRTYVLANPIQYTPGTSPIMIPVQSVAPALPVLERVDTTKEALFPNATIATVAANTPPDATLGTLIDAAVRGAALAGLEALYVGDTIEVLTGAEWAARNAPPATPETEQAPSSNA